ncbi:MAG: hypothetical protein U0T75_01650 [Chitinophagales bacterium]
MKKKRHTLCSVCRDAAVVGVYLLANSAKSKWQQHKQQGNLTEEELQTRLTRLSILYHLIGIIYNE